MAVFFQELLITTYGSESEFSPSRLRFTVGLSTHLQLHAALPATRKTWSVTVSMSPRHLLLGRSRFQGHQLFLDLDVRKAVSKGRIGRRYCKCLRDVFL